MIWLDAQLSPRVAGWIRETLGHDAKALRDIGLRDDEDEEIFQRAKQEKVILPHQGQGLCGSRCPTRSAAFGDLAPVREYVRSQAEADSHRPPRRSTRIPRGG